MKGRAACIFHMPASTHLGRIERAVQGSRRTTSRHTKASLEHRQIDVDLHTLEVERKSKASKSWKFDLIQLIEGLQVGSV